MSITSCVPPSGMRGAAQPPSPRTPACLSQPQRNPGPQLSKIQAKSSLIWYFKTQRDTHSRLTVRPNKTLVFLSLHLAKYKIFYRN